MWCVECCGALCRMLCGGVCGVAGAAVCKFVCYVVYDEFCGVLWSGVQYGVWYIFL